MAEQLGRYPAARRVIAHVSDTHLLHGGAPLGGRADTVWALRQVVSQLERLGDRLDAIVVTAAPPEVPPSRATTTRLEPPGMFPLAWMDTN